MFEHLNVGASDMILNIQYHHDNLHHDTGEAFLAWNYGRRKIGNGIDLKILAQKDAEHRCNSH